VLLCDLSGKQQRKTGTGGAYAPLSEILPAARVARFIRMTELQLALLASVIMTQK
jgi:hypothetical protein